MSRVRMLAGLSAGLALGLAACSDFTSSGDVLTDAEAAEMAEALVEGTFAGFGNFEAAPSGAPGQTDARITDTFSHSAPCEGGGTVALNGSLAYNVNQADSSVTIEFDYTVAPSGCQVTSAGGTTFTLTGDPNLRVNGDFSFDASATGGTFEGSLNYGGKFTWEASDGRAGACGVDLTANYEFTWGTTTTSGSASVTGSVCGVTVSRTVTVEV